tara:strand:- start:11927 stop:12343 length:417 start_codon:yes stop_codon:yes gene_type:complete
VTNFTKTQLKNLRAEMQSLLLAHPFEETIDIPIDKISIDSCNYNGGEATYKVRVLLDGAETKEQKDLTQMASMFNLDTTKIKNYVDHKSVQYRMSLVGYKTKARKMPWIAQDLLSGNEYKLTNQQARQWFMKTEEIVS